MKRSSGEKIFNFFNILFLAFVGLICLYPFIYTLTISLSTAAEASREGFHFYPREISFTSYKMVLSNPNIVTGYVNTIIRTVLGTFLRLQHCDNVSLNRAPEVVGSLCGTHVNTF